jgi:hypothetical protein
MARSSTSAKGQGQSWPRAFSDSELKKLGITILSANPVHLACDHCGDEWSPTTWGNNRLSKGYWKCPNGCNTA